MKTDAIMAKPRYEVAPWPFFAADEIEAVERVLSSGKVNYWTGEEGRLFEKEYRGRLGCGYAIALMNGTVALELALRCFGIGMGDDVIVTPRTFIASISSIVLQGANPVFADIDPVSQNITAATIKAVLTPKTRAIIAVHLAGWPCEMDEIMTLAEEHGIKVIEDCAQAHGAMYRGRHVGSIGHAAAFSFCQDKIVTTGGEGGLLTTNDGEFWEKAWAFKDHGKSYRAVYEKEHPPGFRWLHESFGTNWRLTEVQSAIRRIQLRKLPEWTKKRQRFAAILNENLGSVKGLRLTLPPDYVVHAYYKYYVFVEPAELASGWDRDRIMGEMIRLGVPTFSGSCSEVYREKAFETISLRQEPLPNAKRLGETSLMFQVHPTLSDIDLFSLTMILKKVMSRATV